MKTSVKLHPCLWDLLPVLLILLAAVAAAVLFWPREETQALTAVISLNGEEVYRVDLERLPAEEVYQPSGLDYPLQICLSKEGVLVTESHCPGGDCQRVGRISRVGESIICLPNRLVIRLLGVDDALDAVIG